VVHLKIMPETGSVYLPAGEALPPQVGDIIWQISAGTYANGRRAGAIQWRTSDFNADLLKASTLKFAEPNSAEFYTTYDGTDGGLLSIESFQFTMDVERNTNPDTGYTLLFRDGSNTLYRRYIVSDPDGGSWNDTIRITREDVEGSSTVRTQTWTITKSGSTWTITETNGARLIVRTSSIDGTTGNRIEVVEVKQGSTVATKVTREYKTFSGWGQEEMIKETADPDVSALVTEYAYHETGGTSGYSRLKSVKNPDGSWVRYEYDDAVAGWGNLSAVYRPWQDSPTTPDSATTTASGRAMPLTFSPICPPAPK
jgi:hypothetical protein